MVRILRVSLVLLALAGVALSTRPATAATPKASPTITKMSEGAIEVVEVKGIIDGSVERAVVHNLEEAARTNASLVVLQIDSRGVVDDDRTRRMNRAIRSSSVPVVAWVGPPGAEASNGAVALVTGAQIRAMSPGSTLGPERTLDLRRSVPVAGIQKTVFNRRLSAKAAKDAGVVRFVEPSLDDLIATMDDTHAVNIDVDTVQIRFHKLDIWGRLLHAAAQPSIAYLFLLLALVGIVFELFHPSTGPAGVSGLLALALSVFGVVTLGGSWLGFVLVVAGVAGFAVDLRYESIGLFTIAGLGALVAGSLLLFHGPYLHVSPWLLAFGVVSMTMFLLGAMTRVLRDLRLIARGELEVTDAHPHPE